MQRRRGFLGARSFQCPQKNARVSLGLSTEGKSRQPGNGTNGLRLIDVAGRSKEMRLNATRPFVAVVDDDEAIRDSLPRLLKALGFKSKSFASADAFLASDALQRASCLILDVAMPGMGGLELMRQPAVQSSGTPIIFITALHDEGLRREVIHAGAVECLFKPFHARALVQALDAALRGDPSR
jgi:CheY-like chemotaxis protein